MEEGFVVRRPRHEAIADSGCVITVEYFAEGQVLAAELGDVSRQGLKLLLDAQIPEETRLRVRIEQPANRFKLVINMTVRWSRVQDNGMWAAGCLFDEQLTWETMGELFLNGILSAEEVPYQPSPTVF